MLFCGPKTLTLASVLLSVPSSAEERAVVADRIVAVVGERLVLSSDVALEQALGTIEATTVAQMMDGARNPQQVAIDRAIIRGLAGNASIYVPSDDEILNRESRLRAAFTDSDSWAAFREKHGLQGERLQGHLYSRLVVDRYVLRNVPTDASPSVYVDWIKPHRARVSIRMVAPIEDRLEAP